MRRKGDCTIQRSGTLGGNSIFWIPLVNSAAAVQDPSPGQRGSRLNRDGPLVTSGVGEPIFFMGVVLEGN